jgi:hypothetical protein
LFFTVIKFYLNVNRLGCGVGYQASTEAALICYFVGGCHYFAFNAEVNPRRQ